MKYKIGITEKLHKTIEIEANSEAEALTKVEDMYQNEDIVLSADDYSNTYIDIEEKEVEKEKNIENEFEDFEL